MFDWFKKKPDPVPEKAVEAPIMEPEVIAVTNLGPDAVPCWVWNNWFYTEVDGKAQNVFIQSLTKVINTEQEEQKRQEAMRIFEAMAKSSKTVLEQIGMGCYNSLVYKDELGRSGPRATAYPTTLELNYITPPISVYITAEEYARLGEAIKRRLSIDDMTIEELLAAL